MNKFFKAWVCLVLNQYREWLKVFREMAERTLGCLLAFPLLVIYFPLIPLQQIYTAYKHRREINHKAVSAWWDMRINFFLPWSKKFFLYRGGVTTFSGDITPPSL